MLSQMTNFIYHYQFVHSTSGYDIISPFAMTSILCLAIVALFIVFDLTIIRWFAGLICVLCGFVFFSWFSATSRLDDAILQLHVNIAKVDFPQSKIECLATSLNYKVREAVAQSSNTPVQILILLSKDPEAEVKQTAMNNPHFPYNPGIVSGLNIPEKLHCDSENI